MKTNEEYEDMQKSALILLQDLEFISRRICEGYSTDLSQAEIVIDLLANFHELCLLQNTLEETICSMEGSGVNGKSEDTVALIATKYSRRLNCVRQMSETLKRIKIENGDLNHRVSFVNASIECMNVLCGLFLSSLDQTQTIITGKHSEVRRSRSKSEMVA